MLMSLILTIIVLLCLGLVMQYALPPIGDQVISWAVRVICVLVAVAAILRIWGTGF